MLELRGVSAWYGRNRALHDVNLDVGDQRIVAVIGANGAGKTTLVNSIMGAVPRVRGSIVHRGRKIDRRPAHTRAGDGIVLVPEGRRVFAPLSVLENLRLGAYASRARRSEVDERLDDVYALFPRLFERREQAAGTLSGGEQQMLAIGRALMARPSMLLLDEPSLGLAPLVIDQIFAVLERLNREQNLTLLLIEQNATEALALADDAYVLVNGRVTMSGLAADLAENPEVRSAYLSVASGDDGVAHG